MPPRRAVSRAVSPARAPQPPRARGVAVASALGRALASVLISTLALACGTSAPQRAEPGRAAATAGTAVLPPGTYRMRLWPYSTKQHTYPMAGELHMRPAPASTTHLTNNAEVLVPPGPDGIRVGPFYGSVAAVADTALVNLVCEQCRVPTRYGGDYVDLLYGGVFRVRALGGDRYELRVFDDMNTGREHADTLVRVGG